MSPIVCRLTEMFSSLPKKHGKKTSALDFKKLLAYFDEIASARKASVRTKHLQHLKALSLQHG